MKSVHAAVVVLMACSCCPGCGNARLNYDRTTLGQPLPPSDRLVGEVHRLPAGASLMERRTSLLPIGLHRVDFRAITDSAGRVVGRMHGRADLNYWIVLVSGGVESHFEVDVPDAWFAEPPTEWDSKADYQALKSAIVRLFWRADQVVSESAYRQLVDEWAQRSYAEMIAAVVKEAGRPWIPPGSQPASAGDAEDGTPTHSPGRPIDRHIGTYLMLAGLIMDRLPHAPGFVDSAGLAGWDVLAEEPGFFSGLTGDFNERRLSREQCRFRIRKLGPRRFELSSSGCLVIHPFTIVTPWMLAGGG